MTAVGLKVFVPHDDVIIGTSSSYTTKTVIERCRTILAVLSPDFIAGGENYFLKMVAFIFDHRTSKRTIPVIEVS